MRVVTEKPQRGRRFPSMSLAPLAASGSPHLVSSGARISGDAGTTFPFYGTGSPGPRRLSHLPGFAPLHACFFQMCLRGASARSRWSPGQGEDLWFKVTRGRGHHLGLPLTQLVPHDEMLAGRCRGAELGISGGSGPRGQTPSWGGHEVSLHACCLESQGQSSHGGRGAQSAHCVLRPRRRWL